MTKNFSQKIKLTRKVWGISGGMLFCHFNTTQVFSRDSKIRANPGPSFLKPYSEPLIFGWMTFRSLDFRTSNFRSAEFSEPFISVLTFTFSNVFRLIFRPKKLQLQIFEVLIFETIFSNFFEFSLTFVLRVWVQLSTELKMVLL